jgi:alkaline phosphatase D
MPIRTSTPRYLALPFAVAPPWVALFAAIFVASWAADLSHAQATQPAEVARADPPAADAVLTRIAFASCYNQTPAFHAGPRGPAFDPFEQVLAARPDLFLFIGDNVYADLDRFERDIAIADVHRSYDELDARPGFARLRAAVPILATWDDHDYGLNDAGVELPFKAASQQALLDFFGEPADSPRRAREGVYGAWSFGPEGRRTQVVLLDTRYFRSPMTVEQRDGRRHYVPNEDPAATVLGEAQWAWLERTLREPADLRILASSIQVVAGQHRFEKWANFPLERQRLFDLLADTSAQGVVFVSGDRHHWELSADTEAGPYPIYDLTASGLNQGSRSANREPNRHRVGSAQAFRHPHFGVIDIDWETSPPIVTLSIRSAEDGQVLLASPVLLDTLQPDGGGDAGAEARRDAAAQEAARARNASQ